MRAWLERELPQGDDIVLPETGTLIFGRSQKCTIVFDDATLSPQHCEVSWDGAFWKVKDLGSDGGTRVNGVPIRHSRALHSGEKIEFGATRLRFKTDLPEEDRTLIDAIARSPDAESNWLVYADQLQERGDPLGERIVKSRTGGKLDHMPWLGALWEHFVAGELEIDWQYGFVKRATIRTAAGREAPRWTDLVVTLLNSRIGHFVRALTIDLPRLANVPALGLTEALLDAQNFLAQLPGLPLSIEKLSLGYHVATPAAGSLSVTEELALKLPRLRTAPIYHRAHGIRLRVLSTTPGVALSGIEGSRIISGVTRIRRGQRNQLFIESPPNIPFLADGNPCYFGFQDGRAQLIAGRMRGEVRVNNRIDSMFSLLPDDVIDVQGAARFRLEIVT
ncbi:MAG: FHA domain-containing protein [Archangium sp.]|nr:FHA domain-containing protein [Archangium sp.]